jgi:hypothetical protein
MSGHWNTSSASCCKNALTMRALCGLALSPIKIGLVSQWMIIKMGYNVCITHVVAVCNSTRKAPRQLQRRHRTLLYPSRSRHEMQGFYASRIERGHPRDVWPMDSFPITNIPTEMDRARRWPNEFYGSHCPYKLLTEPSVNSPYRYLSVRLFNV